MTKKESRMEENKQMTRNSLDYEIDRIPLGAKGAISYTNMFVRISRMTSRYNYERDDIDENIKRKKFRTIYYDV